MEQRLNIDEYQVDIIIPLEFDTKYYLPQFIVDTTTTRNQFKDEAIIA